MSPRRRVTVKRTQLKQDKLVNTIFLFTKWVKERQSLVIGGLTGLVIVIILAGVIASGRKKSTERVIELLGQAEIFFSARVYDKAIPILNDLIENYGGKKQSRLAIFYMANVLYNQGNYDGAKGHYERFIEETKEDDLLIPSAIAGIAACLEEKGDFLGAGKRYLEAAKRYPNYYLAPQYLLDAGRCFLSGEEVERAKKTYEDLVSTYPQTEYSNRAELALAEFFRE